MRRGWRVRGFGRDRDRDRATSAVWAVRCAVFAAGLGGTYLALMVAAGPVAADRSGPVVPDALAGAEVPTVVGAVAPSVLAAIDRPDRLEQPIGSSSPVVGLLTSGERPATDGARGVDGVRRPDRGAPRRGARPADPAAPSTVAGSGRGAVDGGRAGRGDRLDRRAGGENGGPAAGETGGPAGGDPVVGRADREPPAVDTGRPATPDSPVLSGVAAVPGRPGAPAGADRVRDHLDVTPGGEILRIVALVDHLRRVGGAVWDTAATAVAIVGATVRDRIGWSPSPRPSAPGPPDTPWPARSGVAGPVQMLPAVPPVGPSAGVRSSPVASASLAGAEPAGRTEGTAGLFASALVAASAGTIGAATTNVGVGSLPLRRPAPSEPGTGSQPAGPATAGSSSTVDPPTAVGGVRGVRPPAGRPLVVSATDHHGDGRSSAPAESPG
ncbi:hypothetical protein O7632_18590 [Solwaraspora sp. WMMD406]|uniref:hypothetical protein n=1 Tax=Solwaraspora sp. WMMD406 TaxID=3016095 RepID=UPI0024165B41|nr:hypothetical protein [Solwaraspora sp. WMMD406]MDG4766096.1 hypothetical protein [Solwaraspora sp. WMMD406]